MLIKTLVVGQLETNCYIVTDEKTLTCAVIDPGDESNTILDYLESNKLTAAAVILTHGHYDHQLAACPVSEATGAPIWIHKADTLPEGTHDIFKLTVNGSVRFYGEESAVSVGGLTFYVMETPGHSPGSVTLRCENALFTGDTLFRDSCGRTDLGEGNMRALMRSLSRISALEGDFEVYPGHMDATTLDRERRFNGYLKYAAEESRD